MQATEPYILLFRGKGLISSIIRWQTRSQYSHAAIWMPDGKLVEAWQGKGVRVTGLESWQGVDAFRVDGAKAAQWMMAIDYAMAQVGAGYDYWAVLRFLTRRRGPRNDKWFCSELVYRSFEYAGIHLLRDVDASEVSPAMLANSPKLLKVE